MYTVWRNCVLEFSFQSRKAYKDPFNDVELDVVFRDPDGAKRRVPAFWAGDDRWTVRFSSPEQTAFVAGGFPPACRRPGGKGLQRYPDRGGAVPRRGAHRRKIRE